MIVDTVIRNGSLVSGGQIFPGGIAIQDGVIAAVGTDASLPEARETIDADGCYITPGFIDAHTHQGLFFTQYGLDIRGQTQLATMGGVTTVVAIERSTIIGPNGVLVPNGPDDVPSYASVIEGARKQISENAYIDYALTLAILTDAHVEEIERAVYEWGITSFKFYMQDLVLADRWAASIGFPREGFDDGTLYAGFEKIGQIGRPAMAAIHAENRPLERVLRDRVVRSGRKDAAALADACSPLCEISSIRDAAVFARHTKAALYVVHLSTADALPEIERAREEGTDITVEVNTPWLCFSTEDDPPGVYGKFLPPLRDRENLERLWEGLRNGTIHCLGTDDATISRQFKETRAQMVAEADRREGRVSAFAPALLKAGEPHNIWTVSPGSSGVETYVPVLMTYGVLAGRLSIERLVQVACENNAKAFALYPKKGVLHVGSDADINIIDPKLKKTVRPIPLPQDPAQVTYSVWEGKELSGWPRLTMVRGKVVCRNGEVVGKAGYGKLVERKNYPKPYPWWPR